MSVLERRHAKQEAKCEAQATPETAPSSARVRKPLEGVPQRSDRAHLNLEKTPLAAARRMDAKRGSWK